MALSKMTTAELKERLMTNHGETAPRTWHKNQLLLRLTELEGIEAVMAAGPPKHSPLREMEIKINKAARKKSDLQDLASEMGVAFTSNETIQVLTLKLMEAAYARTSGNGQDPLGFGMHSHLTYQEAQDQQTSYCQWVLDTAQEGDACFRLRRFAEWLKTNPKKDINMTSQSRGRKGTIKKGPMPTIPAMQSESAAASSESSDPKVMSMLGQLAQAVQTLTQKMTILEQDSKESKRKTSHSEDAGTSNSEWEGVNPA